MAILSTAFWLRLPSTLPSEADYRAVASAIVSQAREGDAVLLDPHWAERARLHLGGVPALNLARDPHRRDVERFSRLFLLSLPDLLRSDPAAAFEFLESARYQQAGEPVRYGRLQLTLFQNEQVERPSFDFTARVAEARVYIRRPDGSHEVCPRQGERHPCGRAPWINVGADVREIAFKPYRCVFAHPAGAEPLVVEYPDVPMGQELKVTAGIVGQIAFRTENYDTVRFEVKVDGVRLAELALPPGDPGLTHLSIDTSAHAGKRRTVQFETWAQNPDWRHFCFDAGSYR